jgi:preprotein translocase subunit SecA
MTALAALDTPPASPEAGPDWSRDGSLARRLAGADFRRADVPRDERASHEPSALERWLRDQAGWWPPRRLQRRDIAAWGERIGGLRAPLQPLDASALAPAFAAAARQLRRAPQDEAALAQLFAVIGEAAWRSLGLWPHPVQFMAARVLLHGRLAEMQTGEGKTLVAALAASAMAGSGAAVHVISTNDYLARRDCEEMQPLFRCLGLDAGHVVAELAPPERRRAYRQPICYVSGKELVFDDLKDRLAGHGSQPAAVTRLHQALWPGGGAAAPEQEPMIPALHYALVDEADSVLIDEARTPMILSRQAAGPYPAELLQWAIGCARTLEPGRHYRLLPQRQIELLPAAQQQAGPLPASVSALWRSPVWAGLLLRQALTALHLYQCDQHYIIMDGKVQIVDESTGRVMADRSWEQGLHQLIEAKEGLALSASRETLARMTFQRFFRRYYLLAGLTGTAAEAQRELWSVYRLRVDRLPPHRPNQRRLLPAQCWSTPAQKWRAVAAEAGRIAGHGQPVLIGTRSVQASEQVAAALNAAGLVHVVLNARQDREEAAIVAAAGQPGRITVATNMAGRGTDIRLDAAARAAGGLHVILTEFHESARVDRQLYGRSGRQGDPGSVRAIVCAQDSLFVEQLGALMRWLAPARSGSAGLLRRLLPLLRWQAQRRAEQHNRQVRLQTLEQDRRLQSLIGFAGAQR